MNLFFEYQNIIIDELKNLKEKKLILLPGNLQNIVVELPPREESGDISTNAALIIAGANKKEPTDCAQIIKDSIAKKYNEFSKIEIASPGFINLTFKLEFWKKYISNLIGFNDKYGSNNIIQKNYNVEFVSANPTGPLHVGHCRGAIIGDVLVNILKFNGHLVTREYYINDEGNQIKNFTTSVYYRIVEITENKPFPKDENLYSGDYIIDIANKIISKKIITDFSNLKNIYNKLSKASLELSIEMIKANLLLLGVKHDIFISESTLIKNKAVEKVIQKLEKLKFVYYGKLEPPKGEKNIEWKKRKQMLFKSTQFGDDVDRPLKKEDNTWTYFAGDIAYHANKIERNFDVLINILGADHSGYIKRLESSVKALSNNNTKIFCKVCQLVKLFKNGFPYKMSKRKGDYVTVSDLVNEVGKDSVRFIMLNRSNEVELDFDFDKVSEQSKDNPVFYVQYAYARINSIFKSLDISLSDEITLGNETFLLNSHELQILKKISQWPKCVAASAEKLEPHRIPYYLYDLSTLFHSYWNRGKINKNYRFVNQNKATSKSRLLLLRALSIVIKNGMSLLGVSTPEKM